MHNKIIRIVENLGSLNLNNSSPIAIANSSQDDIYRCFFCQISWGIRLIKENECA